MKSASFNRVGLFVGLSCCCLLTSGVAASDEAAADASPWHYQLYVDAGYAPSNNQPANGTWRSKSTTYELDEPKLFLAMGNVRKEAIPVSRWGFEFGLQTGVDSEGLVTAPPPAAL